MNNSQLPFCPYCNKKLKYFESWFLHRNGEYICPKCGYNAKITYTGKLKAFLIFSVVMAVFLAILFTIIGNVNLIEVIIVSIPFFIFYILVPFFMVLEKTQQNSYLNKIYDESKSESSDNDTISTENTSVIPNSKIKTNSHNHKSNYENPNDKEKTKIIDAIK